MHSPLFTCLRDDLSLNTVRAGKKGRTGAEGTNVVSHGFNIQESIRQAIRHLTMPFRLFRHGGFAYTFYVMTLLVGTYVLCVYAYMFSIQELAKFILKSFPAHSKILVVAPFILVTLFIVAAFPVIATCCAVPLKTLFLQKDITLKALLKITPHSLVRCQKNLVPSFLTVFKFLSPSLLMIGLYIAADMRSRPTIIHDTYLAATILTTLIILFRSAPLYLCPLTSVCSEYPDHAIRQVTEQALRGKRVSILLHFMVTVAATTFLYASLPHLPKEYPKPLFLHAGLMVLMWYLLTQLAVITIKGLAELDQKASAYNQGGGNWTHSNAAQYQNAAFGNR